MEPFLFIYFSSTFIFLFVIFIFAFESCQNSFSWGLLDPIGLFQSAKYLNFEGESCEIRTLSRCIQETYILKILEKQVLLFLSSLESNLSDLMVWLCYLSLRNSVTHNYFVEVRVFESADFKTSRY